MLSVRRVRGGIANSQWAFVEKPLVTVIIITITVLAVGMQGTVGEYETRHEEEWDEYHGSRMNPLTNTAVTVPPWSRRSHDIGARRSSVWRSYPVVIHVLQVRVLLASANTNHLENKIIFNVI